MPRPSLALLFLLALLPSCGGPPHDECPRDEPATPGCPSASPPPSCERFDGDYFYFATYPMWRIEQKGCYLEGTPLSGSLSATLVGTAIGHIAHVVVDDPWPPACPTHWELELDKASETYVAQRALGGTGGPDGCHPPPGLGYDRQPP